MIYEIINPSDPITFEAEDVQLAIIACIYVGSGKMGLRDESEESVVPPMLFWDEARIAEWLTEKGFDGIDGMHELAKEKKTELAAILRSGAVCKTSERKSLIKAIKAGGGDFQKSLRAYNENERGSLNDICGFMHSLADDIEGVAPKRRVLTVDEFVSALEFREGKVEVKLQKDGPAVGGRWGEDKTREFIEGRALEVSGFQAQAQGFGVVCEGDDGADYFFETRDGVDLDSIGKEVEDDGKKGEEGG